MELEQTPFYEEVKKIVSLGPRPVHHHWTMSIIANGEVLHPIKLLSIATKRAFHNDYGDDIVVKVAMNAGTYHQKLFPNRRDLKAILYREPIEEVSPSTDLSRDIEAQEMRLTLMENNSAVMESNRKYVENINDTNTMDVMTVEFGLVDLTLEKIRQMTFDGIYRNVTTWELIRHILTITSREVSDDLEIRVRGVDVYEPDNNEVKKNIIIPSGTRLTDVPYYLHDDVAGVYNTGFGYFLHNPPPKVKAVGDQIIVEQRPMGKYWYMYPLYNQRRYDASPKGLTLIRIPMERFQNAERTFRRTLTQLICLVTDTTNSVDDTETIQLNYGNGTRFADANIMFDSFGKTANNKTVITRKDNLNEWLAEDRPTKLNNVQFSNRKITSNTFAEASKMSRRLGMFLTCNWDNSDPGSVWPGMPVKYMFMANSQVFEAKGVVQAVEHYTSLASQGITSKRHITTTSFLLFLSKATPWQA